LESFLAWALGQVELVHLQRAPILLQHSHQLAVDRPFLFSSALSLAYRPVVVSERHDFSLVFHLGGFERHSCVIRFQVKSVLLRLDARSHLKDHVVIYIQALGFQFFFGAESVAVLKEAKLYDDSYYLCLLSWIEQAG